MKKLYYQLLIAIMVLLHVTSNGQSAQLIKDIYPGLNPSVIQNVVNVNGILFFSAIDNVNGRELWKSDGTTAGTVLVKDIYPGASSSSIDELTNVNGVLFFVADEGVNGTELLQ